MEEGVRWLWSDSAACQEPQNLPAGAQGTGGVREVLKLSLRVTVHPGWVKLEGKSRSTSQINNEFSERSDAVL